jgi:hypothetical protein
MRLTERDKHILEHVLLYGCLTCEQIRKVAGMQLKNCQRRLRKLCSQDYLRKVPLPTTTAGKAPFLYYGGEAAAALFETTVSKPRLTIRLSHQLRNTDLLITMQQSAAPYTCTVLPEHQIRTEKGLPIIPDGACSLSNGEKSLLFMVECDDGTEIVRSPSFHEDVENKCLRYLDMFKGNKVGLYERYFGTGFLRFRTLFVVADPRRIGGLFSILNEKRFRFIWVTTKTQLRRKGMLAPIWTVPSEGKRNIPLVG